MNNIKKEKKWDICIKTSKILKHSKYQNDKLLKYLKNFKHDLKEENLFLKWVEFQFKVIKRVYIFMNSCFRRCCKRGT